MAADPREPLHLRVMRMSHPNSEMSPIPYMQTALSEVFSLASLASSLQSANAESHSSEFAAGVPLDVGSIVDSNHALLLPTTQGKVFVGESFHAYINLSNLGSTPALRVCLQVELQLSAEMDFSAETRYLLFDNSENPVETLPPSNTFDCSVLHQLTDQGVYTLVCSVTYQNSPYSSQRVLRRLYKFSVGPPFKISHIVNHLHNRAFVQFTLENISGAGVFLKDAVVNCAEGVRGIRLDSAELLRPNRGFRGLLYFKSKEVHSLLFSLSPSPSNDKTLQDDPSFLRKLSSLGNLAVEWRTAMGGFGAMSDYRIETERDKGTSSIELTVVSCPPSVQVEFPFKIEVQVLNRLERDIEPLLVFDREKMSPLFTQGIATQTIGKVLSRQSKCFPLPLIAILPGLHTLQGITVYDPLVQQAHKCSGLCKILAF